MKKSQLEVTKTNRKKVASHLLAIQNATAVAPLINSNKQNETFLKWLTKLSKGQEPITDNLYWHCSLMEKHSLHCSHRI
jgi:hypothetical protein